MIVFFCFNVFCQEEEVLQETTVMLLKTTLLCKRYSRKKSHRLLSFCKGTEKMRNEKG